MPKNNPELAQQFWSKQEHSCRLPRWRELPEIELYMDQVLTLMEKYIRIFFHDAQGGLTPSMINNYVKMGILPAPVKKRYSRVHISRLMIICAMKSVLPIQVIGAFIDHLLKTRTEEELLDFFSEQYEKTFREMIRILRESIDGMTDGDSSVGKMLTLAVMQSTTVSSCSKLIAENALGEMEYLNVLKSPEK